MGETLTSEEAKERMKDGETLIHNNGYFCKWNEEKQVFSFRDSFINPKFELVLDDFDNLKTMDCTGAVL